MFLIIVELRWAWKHNYPKRREWERNDLFCVDANEDKAHWNTNSQCVVSVQITKEHVNNNSTKNGEINTTSIILNDFATTKWELCVHYKCPPLHLFPLFLSHSKSLTDAFFPFVVSLYVCVWAFCLNFFSLNTSFFLLIIFATLYFWSVQAKVLVPNVVANIKAVLLHVFCVCAHSVKFFQQRWL